MVSSQLNKHLTFFSLYVAQSVPMSLVSTLLPILMRQQSFSLTAIGLLQLIKLPWILKCLWAPAVDRTTKSLSGYKTWIISSELCYAFFIFAIAYFRIEAHFPLILTLIVIAFLCSATQDIATDALTTLSYPRSEHSRANSIQSMGNFAGTLLGGGLLVAIYTLIGWKPMFTALSFFVILMLLPLYYYQDKGFKVPQGQSPVGMKDLYRFFTQRGAAAQVLFLFLYNAGLVGILAMMKPYLVDHGYDTTDIGVMFSLFGAACGFLASFFCGRHIKRCGRQRSALLISGFSMAVGVLFAAFSYAGLTAPVFIYLSLALLWSAYGLATVLVYTIAMDYVRDGREGTDFTLQIVIFHLSSMIVATMSGKVADTIGYTGLFAAEAALSLASWLYIKYRFGKTLHCD